MSKAAETKSKENTSNNDVDKEKEKEKVQATPRTILTELKLQLILLEKAVSQKDVKQIQKISNGVRRFKKVIHGHHLQKVFNVLFPNYGYNFSIYRDFDNGFAEEFEIVKQLQPKLSKTIEVDIYLQTLYLTWLVEQRQISEAEKFSQALLSRVVELNKRYLDTLTSIIYFYLSRSHELGGNLENIRNALLSGYRYAVLNYDQQGQAVLLNLILRNFLYYNLFEQANTFVNKTQIPENCSGNEIVRYLYYTGRIKAVRGEYAQALENLNQALRKAPDNTATGFKIEAQKLACLVELLQGDIPNRDVFAQPHFQIALHPYYMIVSTVIKGDIIMFKQIIQKYEQVFLRDKLYNIIQRLHQIVIKIGLRRINFSYSRITLKDIKQKLNLPETSDPELIVAKAIRDGTLNAVIDHENQCIISKERNDIYSTVEPQEAFAKRITQCINVHNQAVKALQYQNPSYEYQEQGNPDELTAEELLNMVDLEGDF